MNIEGAYTLQATPEEVWHLLTRLAVIQQILPGLTQLGSTGPNNYQLSLHIQQEPLRGQYQALVKMTECQFPSYLCFVIEGQGEQNTLNGIGSLYLQKQEHLTVLTYKGSLHIQKQAQKLNATVMKGAAKLLIQQSLSRLSELLRTSEENYSPARVSLPEDILVLPRPAAATKAQRKTIWQAVGRQFHLGHNDPLQEEIWGRRIGRAGSAAGLLLLIWIGTRLPRKRRHS